MESITDRRLTLENDARNWLEEKAQEFHGNPNDAEEEGLPIPKELSHWFKTESGGSYQASSVFRDGVYLLVDGGEASGAVFYDWSEMMEYQIFAVVEMVESIWSQILEARGEK